MSKKKVVTRVTLDVPPDATINLIYGLTDGEIFEVRNSGHLEPEFRTLDVTLGCKEYSIDPADIEPLVALLRAGVKLTERGL